MLHGVRFLQPLEYSHRNLSEHVYFYNKLSSREIEFEEQQCALCSAHTAARHLVNM